VRGRGRKSEENVEESKNKWKWRQEGKIYHKIYEKEGGGMKVKHEELLLANCRRGKKSENVVRL
jgi:hypothetical protein